MVTALLAAFHWGATFCLSCIKVPHPAFLEASWIGEGPAAIFRDDFPFQISDRSGDPSRAIPPARAHCGVKLLSDGGENFALRSQLMKSARRSIDLQTYIFEGDATGRETLQIFQEKMAEGVRVRLIFDAYIRLGKENRRFFEEIERSNIFIGGFEPWYFTFVNANYWPSFRELNMRYHEKYLIVDDRIAVTGGTNIGDEYAGLGAAPGTELRDQDVLLTGPVVEDMRRAFAQNYQEFQELEKSRPAFLHHLHDRKKQTPAPETAAAVLAEDAFPLGDFTDDDAMVRLIRSRPRRQETYIYQAYLFLIRSAKKSILIENSYYIPDREMAEALYDAARRGVEVVMILDCGKPKDPGQMQPTIARYYYLPLLEAGVKVYEWQTGANGQDTLHSKVAVFDQEVSVIGSFNLDPRCRVSNTEDVVVIDSGKVALALHDYLFSRDVPRSELVTREKALASRRPREFIHLVKLFCALSIKYFW